MKHFARLETGCVVELLTTHADPSDIFHPSLNWRETRDDVQIGWLATDTGFEPSTPPVATPTPPPDLAQLQADLSALIAKFAAFQAG
jgi:hypothetical protein